MKIQSLKPGKCSLTLDASRIIQGTQQTDFSPDATTTFSPKLALSTNEAWKKKHQPLLLGTPQISKFQPIPPHNAPTQHEGARSISAHNTNKRLKC
jgi:hypothetical protein